MLQENQMESEQNSQIYKELSLTNLKKQVDKVLKIRQNYAIMNDQLKNEQQVNYDYYSYYRSFKFEDLYFILYVEGSVITILQLDIHNQSQQTKIEIQFSVNFAHNVQILQTGPEYLLVCLLQNGAGFVLNLNLEQIINQNVILGTQFQLDVQTHNHHRLTLCEISQQVSELQDEDSATFSILIIGSINNTLQAYEYSNCIPYENVQQSQETLINSLFSMNVQSNNLFDKGKNLLSSFISIPSLQHEEVQILQIQQFQNGLCGILTSDKQFRIVNLYTRSTVDQIEIDINTQVINNQFPQFKIEFMKNNNSNFFYNDQNTINILIIVARINLENQNVCFLNLNFSFKKMDFQNQNCTLKTLDPKQDLNNICEISLMQMFNKNIKQMLKDITISNKGVLLAIFDNIQIKTEVIFMNSLVTNYSIVLTDKQQKHNNQIMMMDTLDDDDCVYVIRGESIGQLIGSDLQNDFESIGMVEASYYLQNKTGKINYHLASQLAQNIQDKQLQDIILASIYIKQLLDINNSYTNKEINEAIETNRFKIQYDFQQVISQKLSDKQDFLNQYINNQISSFQQIISHQINQISLDLSDFSGLQNQLSLVSLPDLQQSLITNHLSTYITYSIQGLSLLQVLLVYILQSPSLDYHRQTLLDQSKQLECIMSAYTVILQCIDFIPAFCLQNSGINYIQADSLSFDSLFRLSTYFISRVRQQLLFSIDNSTWYTPPLLISLLNWREYTLLFSILSSPCAALSLSPDLHFLTILCCIKLDLRSPSLTYLSQIHCSLSNITCHLGLQPSSTGLYTQPLNHYLSTHNLPLSLSQMTPLFHLLIIQLAQYSPRVAVQLSHHALLLDIQCDSLKQILFSTLFKHELSSHNYPTILNMFKVISFQDSSILKAFYEQFIDSLIIQKTISSLSSLNIDSAGYTHIYQILKDKAVFQLHEIKKSGQNNDELMTRIKSLDQDKNYTKILRLVYLQNNDFQLSAVLMHGYCQHLLQLTVMLEERQEDQGVLIDMLVNSSQKTVLDMNLGGYQELYLEDTGEILKIQDVKRLQTLLTFYSYVQNSNSFMLTTDSSPLLPYTLNNHTRVCQQVLQYLACLSQYSKCNTCIAAMPDMRIDNYFVYLVDKYCQAITGNSEGNDNPVYYQGFIRELLKIIDNKRMIGNQVIEILLAKFNQYNLDMLDTGILDIMFEKCPTHLVRNILQFERHSELFYCVKKSIQSNEMVTKQNVIHEQILDQAIQRLKQNIETQNPIEQLIAQI